MRILHMCALAFCCWAASACGYAASQEIGSPPDEPGVQAAPEDQDAQSGEGESVFFSRTPDEYRDRLMKALNAAQMEAIIEQQLVQEIREKGEEHTDQEFYAILNTPEMRAERQLRVDRWVKEQKDSKENALKFSPKFLIGIGMVVVVLLLILLCGGKRNPVVENASDSEKKD